METENAEPQVVFRSSKKRKHFRQRAEQPDAEDDGAATNAAVTSTQAQAQDDQANPHGDNDATSETEGLSVTEVLRLRAARKSRLKGVGFRPEGADAATKDEDTEQSLALRDDANSAEAVEYGVSRRFAPQAGLVGELVNKHM